MCFQALITKWSSLWFLDASGKETGKSLVFCISSDRKSRKATIRPKRQFVPSDNSSQATIRPKFQKATIRPKRQFVPF